MSGSFRLKFTAFFAAVFLAVLVAELFLRAYFAVRTNGDIEMWRYAVELKQEVADRRSHVHAPGRSARLMNVDVSLNSKGLRDRELPYDKPHDAYRILCLGDSLTFGWGVASERTFCKQIERELVKISAFGHRFSAVETLNMGVGNYNTEQELETYLREGRRYHADSVLLFFHITDAEPTQKHSLNFFARNSYLYAFLSQRIAQLKPYVQASNHYIGYYQNLYSGPTFARFRPTLDELVAAVSRDHVKLIPVILPDVRNLENYPFRAYHEAMTEYFAEKGIQAIDLRREFDGKISKDYVVSYDDPHPNALGHDLIARTVVRELQERRLLP
jgi:lysophospholipase L1-like esterase